MPAQNEAAPSASNHAPAPPAPTDAAALLTIADADRTLAADLFRGLSRRERLEFVRSTPLERRYDMITLADDATTLVRELAVSDLYALIRHDGRDRTGSLVECAAPEQVRGVMDFACWRDDVPDDENALAWLTWVSDLADGPCAERLATLDAAFLATVLGPHVRISDDAVGEFLVVETRVDALPTGLDYDDEDVERIMYRLYEVDHGLFDEVVNRVFVDEWTHDRGTHGGLRQQRAEAAALRATRLRALEVSDTYEARMDLLQPLEIPLIPRDRPFLSVLPDVAPRTSPIDGLLAATDDPGLLGRWRDALARLAVDVIMARGGDPGDSAALRRSLGYVRSAVSVALDALAGGSREMAPVLAVTWDWVDLFRAGHTLVERLRWHAGTIPPAAMERAENRVWMAGLLRSPLRVYDPATASYRLPDRAADLIRAHRVLYAIQLARHGRS